MSMLKKSLDQQFQTSDRSHTMGELNVGGDIEGILDDEHVFKILTSIQNSGKGKQGFGSSGAGRNQKGR